LEAENNFQLVWFLRRKCIIGGKDRQLLGKNWFSSQEDHPCVPDVILAVEEGGSSTV